MNKIITFTIISFISTFAIAGSESGTGSPESNSSSNSNSNTHQSIESCTSFVESVFQSVLASTNSDKEAAEKQKDAMMASCEQNS